MTQLLGGADGSGLVYGNDLRIGYPQRDRQMAQRLPDRQLSYATPWWPYRGGLQGDAGVDIGPSQGAQYYGPIERMAQGAASRVGFIGITRDANGAPLGGVTCSLFHTSDRLWIMDFVSRSDGSFTLQSWFSPDTHFIVFSKAGSPDVFGATKQTLVGA